MRSGLRDTPQIAPFLKIIKIFLDKYTFTDYNDLVTYLGVAQFGSVLEWGSRGREFESLHSDQNKKSCRKIGFFILYYS